MQRGIPGSRRWRLGGQGGAGLWSAIVPVAIGVMLALGWNAMGSRFLTAPAPGHQPAPPAVVTVQLSPNLYTEKPAG
jgi:hypothetical protein